MKLPRLISSDLDGTLILTEGTGGLTDRALELIEKYIDMGGVFVAASGRQPENMFDLFGSLKDRIGYVCYSGGLCLYRGETVYERYFDRELAADLISGIESSEDCEAMVSVRGTELISPKEPQMYSFLTGSVGAYTTVIPDLNVVSDGIFKISLYNKDGKIDRAYWKNRFGSRCSALDSGEVWIDFIPTGINKGAALKALLDKLVISPADCVAFGDNENDKHILELVGCPIVMSHSEERIRALGKYTTDTVEEALETILAGNQL